MTQAPNQIETNPFINTTPSLQPYQQENIIRNELPEISRVEGAKNNIVSLERLKQLKTKEIPQTTSVAQKEVGTKTNSVVLTKPENKKTDIPTPTNSKNKIVAFLRPFQEIDSSQLTKPGGNLTASTAITSQSNNLS